jgi:hypothetical protein
MAALRLALLVGLCVAFASGVASPATAVPESSRAPAVVGGAPASPATYPWVVALDIDNVYAACTGSLIGERWVLTAAHCVYESPVGWFNQAVARVGASGASDGTPVAVEDAFIPDSYPATSLPDYALLRLAAPVTQAALRLPDAQEGAAYGPGTTTTVLGYGYTSDAQGNGVEAQLYGAELDVLANSLCRASQYFDAPSELCASVPGVGICSGDSGGPLIAASVAGPVQIGISSWSPAFSDADYCAESVPSYFVRTASVIPSIVAWLTTDTVAPVTTPVGQTGVGSAPTTSGVLIAGSVVPNGLATAYRIDYGTSTQYGASVGGYAGSGFAAVPVQQQLNGLASGTTYHYRVVAISAAGTSAGADQTFTTTGQPASPNTGGGSGLTVRAISSRGIAGQRVTLKYRVTGDQGSKTQERIQIRLAGAVVARFSSVFDWNPAGGRTSITWRAPARLAGRQLTFCVSTHFRTEAWTDWSCASLRLR